jgi:hypothetical protein
MSPPRPALALALLLAAAPAQAEPPEIAVAKTSACGCCVAWIEHLEAAGFSVRSENLPTGSLIQRKLALGVPQPMASCHTAEVGGYVVEGHVPAGDIRRLLEERPEARGLAVPGMPLGSPGMDQGSRSERYEVHLIRKDGTTEVFSAYGE